MSKESNNRAKKLKTLKPVESILYNTQPRRGRHRMFEQDVTVEIDGEQDIHFTARGYSKKDLACRLHELMNAYFDPILRCFVVSIQGYVNYRKY